MCLHANKWENRLFHGVIWLRWTFYSFKQDGWLVTTRPISGINVSFERTRLELDYRHRLCCLELSLQLYNSLRKATAAVFLSHSESLRKIHCFIRRPHTLCHLSRSKKLHNTLTTSCLSINFSAWLKYLLFLFFCFCHKCFTDSIILPVGAAVLKPRHPPLLFLDTDSSSKVQIKMQFTFLLIAAKSYFFNKIPKWFLWTEYKHLYWLSPSVPLVSTLLSTSEWRKC